MFQETKKLTNYKLPAEKEPMSTQTFLEYVITKCIGRPAKPGGSPGESYWCCPFHTDSHPSFHTRPHRPPHRDRWSCFGCGLWGDEADFLMRWFPGERYPARKIRLQELQTSYTLQKSKASSENTPALNADVSPDERQTQATGYHPLPGTGTVRVKCQHKQRELDSVWGSMTPVEHEAIMTAYTALRREGVSLREMAKYCFGFVRNVQDSDKYCLEICGCKGNCGAACCRLGRVHTAREIRAAWLDRYRHEQEERRCKQPTGK